jgi:hypothetical protein
MINARRIIKLFFSSSAIAKVCSNNFSFAQITLSRYNRPLVCQGNIFLLSGNCIFDKFDKKCPPGSQRLLLRLCQVGS